MHQNKIVYSALLLAGLGGIIVGGGIVVNPTQFHASLDIVIGGQAALINEMRAAGAAILGVGMFALLSLRLTQLRSSALIITSLSYGFYAMGRLVGFVLDGVPNDGFLWVSAFELFIAGLCALALVLVSSKPARLV